MLFFIETLHQNFLNLNLLFVAFFTTTCFITTYGITSSSKKAVLIALSKVSVAHTAYNVT